MLPIHCLDSRTLGLGITGQWDQQSLNDSPESVLAQVPSVCWALGSGTGFWSILDGEVVALDEQGRMDFRALLASKGWLHYAAFDLLWLNGKDLRAQPLIKRKRRLEQLIPANNATLSRVLAVEEHGRELYEAAQRLDLEGIVAKRKVDPYSCRPFGTR